MGEIKHDASTSLTTSYAGFWVRVAANILDLAIVGLFYFSAWHMMEMQMDHFDRSWTKLDKEIDYYLGIRPDEWHPGLFLMIFNWAYFAGLESSPFRGTLGKWILGIYVTDEKGERITFGRATGRHFSKIISALILGIGYLMAGFTERKQALHDKIAGCLVYRK